MVNNLYKKTIRELEKLVSSEEPAAMHELARRLVQGEGIAEDDRRGFNLATRASQLGYAPADTVLGYCYFYGKAVALDQKRGVELFIKAAEAGHDAAQYNAGIAYERGTIIAQDYQKAYNWYQKAAEQGFSKAYYKLGVFS